MKNLRNISRPVAIGSLNLMFIGVLMSNLIDTGVQILSAINYFELQDKKMLTVYKDEEILGAYEDWFHNEGDFDIDDVKERLQEFLTAEEYKEVFAEPDNKSKIQKLFFIVIYKKKRISDFLGIFQGIYDWLADHLKYAIETKTTLSNFPIDAYRKAIRDIPNYDDSIVHRCGFVSFTGIPVILISH